MPGTNLGSKIHSALGSEEDFVVVTREEESAAKTSQVLNPNKRSERSPIPDFVEEALSDPLSDEMPTCLK